MKLKIGIWEDTEKLGKRLETLMMVWILYSMINIIMVPSIIVKIGNILPIILGLLVILSKRKYDKYIWNTKQLKKEKVKQKK